MGCAGSKPATQSFDPYGGVNTYNGQFPAGQAGEQGTPSVGVPRAIWPATHGAQPR